MHYVFVTNRTEYTQEKNDGCSRFTSEAARRSGEQFPN